MSEMKTLTLNGKTYDSFVDNEARKAIENFEIPEGGATPEQIEQAVDKYLEAHPVSGLSSTEKNLILTLFRNAAYTSTNMEPTFEQLEELWSGNGGGEEPDIPEKTLTSISAIYSGGNVPVGTAVTALTGIVVTAHYSDGSTATVTGYTLSGTISEGSNTVTVSYGGKTTTFVVTGIAAEEPDVPIETYTVTNNLTNCASNNNSASINKGSTYTATITANDGYTLDGASISVVVNGEDITDMAYRSGVITVNNVIGNLVITVVAVEVVAEEVTLLKSITGDGASWIDTEVLPETTHRYEISATLSETASDTTQEYFIGCDMYNVGAAYGSFYLAGKSVSAINGMLNRNVFTNIGSWNHTEGNSLTNKQAYFVIKDGEQKIYLDAEYTTQQTALTNGTTVWGSGSNTEVPIIPIYLFRVNYTDQVHPASSNNYNPTTTGLRFTMMQLMHCSMSLFLQNRVAKSVCLILLLRNSMRIRVLVYSVMRRWHKWLSMTLPEMKLCPTVAVLQRRKPNCRESLQERKSFGWAILSTHTRNGMG